jgi:hypothetical protein
MVPPSNAQTFRTKELLCWREDLSFFNLRWYFLNCFKALQMCWTAVRNNKRIAFVGLGGSVMVQASVDAMNLILKSNLRDGLPRIKTLSLLPSYHKSTPSPSYHGRKPRKHRPNLFFSRLIRLLTNNPQPKTGANRANILYLHRLQGQVGKVAARLSIIPYGSASPAFFSNTLKPLNKTFNHLSGLDIHLLKQSPGAFDRDLHSLKRFPLNLNLPQALGPVDYDEISDDEEEDMEELEILGDEEWLRPYKPSRPRVILNPIPKNPYVRKKKGRYLSRAFRRGQVSRKLTVSSAFFDDSYDDLYDYYESIISVNCLRDQQRFAKNANLNQADVVFFTNPDRMASLASQVRNLQIPTIGIISGFKSLAHRPAVTPLRDSVTFPIVGNPDNCFFVILMVHVFTKLIMKASL